MKKSLMHFFVITGTILLMGTQGLLGVAAEKPNWFIVPNLVPLETTTSMQIGAKALIKLDQDDIPTDVKDPFDREAIAFLQQHGLLPSFKDKPFQPGNPVTFAEWDALLYDVINEKTWFLSEEPYYPDVPVTHWAFLVYEKFRLKQWLNPNRALLGKMTPDKPITIRDVTLSLAQSVHLFAAFTDKEAAKLVLERYKVNTDTLPETDVIPVATILSSGFSGLAKMDGQHILTRSEAVQLAYQRYLMTQDNWVLDNTERVLPEGLALQFRSTSIIFQTRMEVGLPLYFVLTKPVSIPALSLSLPSQSRLFGQVDTLEMDGDLPIKTHIRLNQLILPNGQVFVLKSDFDLNFKKEDKGYLPSETLYEVTTEPVYAKAR